MTYMSHYAPSDNAALNWKTHVSSGLNCITVMRNSCPNTLIKVESFRWHKKVLYEQGDACIRVDGKLNTSFGVNELQM